MFAFGTANIFAGTRIYLNSGPAAGAGAGDGRYAIPRDRSDVCISACIFIHNVTMAVQLAVVSSSITGRGWQ